MRKYIRKIVLVLLFFITINVKAEIITVSSKTTIDNQEISSSTNNKSSLYVINGDLTLKNSKVFKGEEAKDEDLSNKDNSAVLVGKNSKITIIDSNIETDALFAHGIYLEKDSENIIKTSEIKTNRASSAGIVNDGGKTTINNTYIHTHTRDSSTLLSLAGNISFEYGRLETNEGDSPLFKVASKVSINSSYLISNKSEGFIGIGGANIRLNETLLTCNMTKKSSINDNYYGILLYNPEELSNKNKVNVDINESELNIKNGDTFNIFNADANIKLTDTSINNENNIFLKGDKSNITLKLVRQTINGKTILDDSSKLTIYLNNSTYNGSINNDKKAKNVEIVLTKDSRLILSEDCYVDSVTNEDYDNTNIELNGHHLYINGEDISKDNINHLENNETLYTILGVIIGVMLGFSIVYLTRIKKNNEK